MDYLSKPFTFYAKQLSYKSFFDEKAKKKRYFVKGHIDSEDLDLVNDIVTKDCMRDISTQFKGRSIKLDFDHETLRQAANGHPEFLNLTRSPLGKALTEELDEKGNFVHFELNPNYKLLNKKGEIVKTFNEIWSEIKSGFLDAFSIAYFPVRSSTKSVKGNLARLLDRVLLINVALTGNAINPGASLTEAMAKSLEWLKENESKSHKQKSYEKDGSHAHTENEPLGNHNHPEIENAIRSEYNWLSERIRDLEDKYYSLGSERSEATEQALSVPYQKGGIKMSEDDQPAQGADGKPAEKAGVEGADGKAAKPDEKSLTELSEVKSLVVELKSAMDKVTADNAEVKSKLEKLEAENAEFKSVIEAARPAAKGAEDAAAKKDGAEVKALDIVGPLDLI